MNRTRLVRWLAILSLIALPATGTLARPRQPICPYGSYSCPPAVCLEVTEVCPSPIDILRQPSGELR